MQFLKTLLGVIFFLSLGCKSSQPIIEESFTEEVVFDTLSVTPESIVLEEKAEPLNPYRPSAHRKFDLIHTKLNLSFDWKKQHVLGEATLSIQPIFKPLQKVVLDAQGMLIHFVRLNDKYGDLLPYEYDGSELEINLSSELKRGETVHLYIDYTARPNESNDLSGGAITSDKGLFFIDPLDQDEYKPSQIWTQGETENNSKWFPTFDKPNERCSQEIFVTVDDKYTTLSNGKLIQSTQNEDGTRTDYWKQEQPHAPYLFMLAIGEFAQVNDTWNGIPLNYLVEPEYKESAAAIFDHTPEMLAYFSEILDYPYPWDKYAQVVTRDYVSGAMENTSAVIFGEFVQKHKRELIDNDNDYIVAHEMFHHWFGDLVTCESWANLTLNEGFANYSEYLWAEHNSGRMRADHHRLNEMEGYLNSMNFHPLIHYRYSDKEDMFDAHSYNKGGLVLHMLRNYVGDDAFFASLSKYLKDNAYSAVEVDELRMAFEDTTGEDLNWFFDQWYHKDGHPIISVEYNYNQTNKTLSIYTTQVGKHNFRMPFNVALYDEDGGHSTKEVWIEHEKDTILIENVEAFNYVFDGTNTNLAVVTEDNKTAEQYLHQFKNSSLFLDKYKAFIALVGQDEQYDKLIKSALSEDYYLFKEMALEQLMESGDTTSLSRDEAVMMALTDDHSQIRLMALQYLSQFPEMTLEKMMPQLMSKEQAYPVLSMALILMSEMESESAMKYADRLKDEPTNMMDEGLSFVFSNSKENKYQNWYERKIKTTQIFNALPLYLGYANYALQHLPNKNQELIKDLEMGALNFDQGIYQRYFSTMILANLRALYDTKGKEELKTLTQKSIDEIRSKETDEMLKSWYMHL